MVVASWCFFDKANLKKSTITESGVVLRTLGSSKKRLVVSWSWKPIMLTKETLTRVSQMELTQVGQIRKHTKTSNQTGDLSV